MESSKTETEVVGSGPVDVLHNEDDFYRVAIPILTHILESDNKIMPPPVDIQIRQVYRQTLERMSQMTLVELLDERPEEEEFGPSPAMAHLTRLCLSRPMQETLERLHEMWPGVVIKALKRDRRWYETTPSARRHKAEPKTPPRAEPNTSAKVVRQPPKRNPNLLGPDDTVMGVRVRDIERFPGMYRPAAAPTSLPAVSESPEFENLESGGELPPLPERDSGEFDLPAPRTPPRGAEDDDDDIWIKAGLMQRASTERFPGMGKPAPSPTARSSWRANDGCSSSPRVTHPETPGSKSSPSHGSSSAPTSSGGSSSSSPDHDSSSFVTRPLSTTSRRSIPLSPASITDKDIDLVYAIACLRHDKSTPFPPPDSAVDQLVACFQDLSLQELLLGVIPNNVKETVDGLKGLTPKEMKLVLPDLARLTLMEWHQPDDEGDGGEAGKKGGKGGKDAQISEQPQLATRAAGSVA
ncbi:hypothetical protein DL546_008631 [Coniochaeta pulveracea]|uniref:Uncharacterized protein n=1 Tax=Coniochaeta pulveracea TaxID=177199 RepID=A0A420YHB3_9PEZI|nr:hypothetical protein DL546_008631 [Coniochaeta pulveracea]